MTEQYDALWKLARLDGRKALVAIDQTEGKIGLPAEAVPELAVCRAFALLDIPRNEEAQKLASIAHEQLNTNYTPWFTKSQVTLAWAYLNQGDLALAQSLALEAYRIARDNRDDEAIALSLSLRGWLNYRKGLDKEAQEVLQVSAHISEQMGHHFELSQRLVEIAAALRRTGKLKEAVEAYTKALDGLRAESTPFRDLILGGIAYCQAHTGSRTSSIRRLMSSADEAHSQGRPRTQAQRYFEVAQLLNQPGELTQSVQFGVRAARISIDNGLVFTGMNSMQLLVENYRKNGEYERAHETEAELRSLRDHIEQQSSMRRLHFTMVRLNGLGRKAA